MKLFSFSLAKINLAKTLAKSGNPFSKTKTRTNAKAWGGGIEERPVQIPLVLKRGPLTLNDHFKEICLWKRAVFLCRCTRTSQDGALPNTSSYLYLPKLADKFNDVSHAEDL